METVALSDGGPDPVPNLALSVVLVIVSDTGQTRRDGTHLADCLEALSRQVDPPPMEIIVPFRPPVQGIDELRRRYPRVSFVEVTSERESEWPIDSREHHDELRAVGVNLARGAIVGFLEDHAPPDSRWCAHVVAAHRGRYAGYAAVGGAIENGVDRPLNWAVYFSDFSRYQSPITEGESAFASDANVTYKRSALLAIRSTWQHSFQETAVHHALCERGEKLGLTGAVVVVQQRRDLSLGRALRERFIWGRSYAGTRSRLVGKSRRFAYACAGVALPVILILRMALTILKKGRNRRRFVQVLPLTSLLTTSWVCGELVGYWTGRPAGAGPGAYLDRREKPRLRWRGVGR